MLRQNTHTQAVITIWERFLEVPFPSFFSFFFSQGEEWLKVAFDVHGHGIRLVKIYSFYYSFICFGTSIRSTCSDPIWDKQTKVKESRRQGHSLAQPTRTTFERYFQTGKASIIGLGSSKSFFLCPLLFHLHSKTMNVNSHNIKNNKHKELISDSSKWECHCIICLYLDMTILNGQVYIMFVSHLILL